MLFWNSLWRNDHAITYLSEKHLALAPRKVWGSLPRWVKILALCAGGLLGLLGFLVVAQTVVQQGLFAGLSSAGFGCMILGVYGAGFWGLYRTWTVGALLSKLRQGGALPTFLYTAVSVQDTVDVLAARAFRQIVGFVMFPVGTMVLAATALIPEIPWSVPVLMAFMLGYFAVLGAFGFTAVHAAAADSAPKAMGKGLLVCLGSFYAPFIVVGIWAGLFPAAGAILAGLMATYLLYLPFLLRGFAIRWLEAEPPTQKRSLVAGLIAAFKSKVPRLPGASFFQALADRNPVLARNISTQNFLLPVGVGLGLLFVTTLILSPSVPDRHQAQFAWVQLHVVTWLTAVALAVAAFLSSYSSVSPEKRSGSLDILRTTPLSSRTVIDGWAIGAFWAYLVAALAVMLGQLPGSWGALIFALSLPVCAGYGGIVSALKDSTGTWIFGGVGGVIFCSWVALPMAFVAGAVHAHAALAVFVVSAAWYLRRRALFAYDG